MEELSPRSRTEHVVLMKGAQVGATECGNNLVGYVIAHSPGPILYVMPTLDMAKRTSRQRIQPMIDACPALSDKVQDRRARDSGNAMMAKEFPGGLLVMTGANSPIGLRSMPARYLVLDEVDGYERDIGGEGDPVELARKRTETFKRNRKIFELSTPTVHHLSRIESAFGRSDQRYYHVSCPHCGDMAPITWSRITWQKDEAGEHMPETAALACEACGSLVEERHKTQMLAGGEWIPEAPGPGKAAGFHLSALYSPLGWYSWQDAVRDFLAAKNEHGIEGLKTWTNTVLGETWVDPGETVSHSALYARREHYSEDTNILVLTCGCDIQQDRIECTLDGWSVGEERYTLEHRVIWGDTTRDDVWSDLDDYLEAEYELPSGRALRIACTCIDSGFLTSRVYQYVRPRQVNRVYAVKGFAGPGRAVVDFGHHFQIHESIDEEYFRQLTAETKVTRFVKGFPREEWEKRYGRNEALDCAVYSYAALQILRPNWEALDRRAEKRDKPQEKPKRGAASRLRRPGRFAGGWRK
jgi:phage terminase large subunit GpA-like protein